ncbi:MAG: FGGY family carbohydrate kinase [Methylococcales bacterium]
MSRYYLGLDCSTQSMSSVLIDVVSTQLVYQQSLNFSTDLSGYGVTNGFLPGHEAGVVHAPPLMWIEGLDQLLLQMQADDCPLEQIIAVAGSGQQHGSVYVNRSFNEALKNCNPTVALDKQLTGIFSRATAPIWMDSSTGRQCEEITTAFGGANKVNEATGSVAVERFTGAQIKKFAEQEPVAYAQTESVMLVSSFLASLLSGRHVGIDYTDASGMNILDIRNRIWHPTSLVVCGENLQTKLMPAIDPTHLIGEIADYFVKRYGFNSACKILPWSGDNPSSLIGLGLVDEGMTAISLGTSDTCFGLMQQLPQHMSRWAHTFIAPTNDYMSLLCFKNGSLAREAVCEYFRLNWDEFSSAIESTQPGNQGAMMLPWFDNESVPKVDIPGVQRFTLDENDAAGNCRAVVEGQMMSMRNHAEEAGLVPTSIRATGGASQNKAILQVMANVFACPVDVLEISNSAVLGAALRAVQAVEQIAWGDVVANFTRIQAGSRVEPDVSTRQIYDRLRKTYAEHERRILN